MSTLIATEPFWIDFMNIAVGLLVVVPLVLVTVSALREGLRRA